MPTQKEAKTMAKSLRDALADRDISLTHSSCLELVARQFGFSDWNTLSVKFFASEMQRPQRRDADAAPTNIISPHPSSTVSVEIPGTPPDEGESYSEVDGNAEISTCSEPWSACSFCGKTRDELRYLIGGCGDWEAARTRGGPERANVFICDECARDVTKAFADIVRTAKEFPPD